MMGLTLLHQVSRPARQIQHLKSMRNSNLSWQTSFSPTHSHPFEENSLAAAFSIDIPKQKNMKALSNHQIKSEWIQLVNPSSTLNPNLATRQDRSENTNILIEPARTRDVLSRLDLNKYTLIQVNSKTNPPICKIKSKEEINLKEIKKEKQQKQQKKSNRHENIMKEIQLKWTIDVHDLNHKLKSVQYCFDKNFKVKLVFNPIHRHHPNIDTKDKDELLLIVEEQLIHFGGQLVKRHTEDGKLIMEWHPIKKEK